MSVFVNANITPSIGITEEQAQLIDIAQSFCRDKSPVDRVRALLGEILVLTLRFGPKLPNWAGSVLGCQKILAVLVLDLGKWCRLSNKWAGH